MTKKTKVLTFRKGQIVKSGTMVVLVSGKGEPLSYPTFSGTVLYRLNDDDDLAELYPIGFYGTSWNVKAFSPAGLSMKNIMAPALKKV